MAATKEDDVVLVMPPPRRRCGASSMFRCCVMVITAMTFLSILLLAEFIRGHVAPMVASVSQVINKADVVFNLLYEYLCLRTQLVSPTDCVILQNALA